MTAIHLRTGDRAAADLIDAWFERNDIAVTNFADPFAACVHLLTRSSQVPAVVFIGTDWLAGDEFAIIEYVRQTWPAAVIVAYGGESYPRPQAGDPQVLVCRSRAALSSALAELSSRLHLAPPGPGGVGSSPPRLIDQEPAEAPREPHADPAGRQTTLLPDAASG